MDAPQIQPDHISVLEQVLADLQQNKFPPHIAELSVTNRIKRAFALYEQCGITQLWGIFPDYPKDIRASLKSLGYKNRSAFSWMSIVPIWWCYFFGPLYYFAAGMWRKGLVLFPLECLLVFAIDKLFTLITGTEIPQSWNVSIALGLGYMVGVMATYDLYRLKIKKETFWW
ncbi:MAG: DUF2628 domain-containing protein [Desulfobulbaceae bacterium]|jgi:hypothetical protein|nr:DUF2628 domain-containing protein [Desulfobulbaceae bacterium]